jgi:hypothetical protein
VFIGLMLADPQAYLSADPRWKPTAGKFGCRLNGEFNMVALLEYVRATPPV